MLVIKVKVGAMKGDGLLVKAMVFYIGDANLHYILMI